MYTTSYLPAHGDAIFITVAWRGHSVSAAGIEFAFNSRSMMDCREGLWRAGRCLIVLPLLQYAAGLGA